LRAPQQYNICCACIVICLSYFVLDDSSYSNIDGDLVKELH
jgi:hypothetical protein